MPDSALEIALEVIEKYDYSPLPVQFKSKRPTEKNWLKLRITPENVRQHFNGQDQNIGVRLGEASGGLADVDLDCDEAIRLAPAVLPATRTFGRKSRPQSHWLFKVKGALPNKTAEFGIELRFNGHQTVFPGSTHESGEPIRWTENTLELPIEIKADELVRAVDQLRAAVVLLDHWKKGQRDELCYALCGCLLRADWEIEQIEVLVGAVAQEAGDEEAADRIKKIARMEDADKLPGIPKLRYALGDDADTITRLLRLEPPAIDQNILLAELNAKHAIIRDGDKYKILHMVYDPYTRCDEPGLIKYNDLRLYYQNQPGVEVEGQKKPLNQITWWLQQPGRRECKGFVLDPECTDPDVYNLWQGWAVKPDPDASCDLYLEHVRKNIAQGDDKIYNYLLDWMADAIQHPTERPGIAVAMRGGQGTGKGQFVKHFGALYGKHHTHVKDPQHFLGRFNVHLQYCLLLFADEAVWAGDKKAEGKLKGLITEDNIQIEAKFANMRTMLNNIRVMMASNHDWIAPAGMGERRFFVLDVGEERMQDHKYFGALNDQMKNGGCGALLHLLQTCDLSEVNLRKFPMTSALLEQKLATMEVELRFLYHIAMEGMLPGDRNGNGIVNKSVFYQHYQQFARNVGGNYRLAPPLLGTKLHRILPGLGSKRPHRSARCYVFPPLAEVRQCLDEKLWQKVTWSDQDDWEPELEVSDGEY